jgi:hypothetical protein
MDSNDLDFLFKIMMLMFVFLGLGGLLSYAILQLHKQRASAATVDEADEQPETAECQVNDWANSHHPWEKWKPIRSGSYLMQYRCCGVVLLVGFFRALIASS